MPPPLWTYIIRMIYYMLHVLYTTWPKVGALLFTRETMQ